MIIEEAASESNYSMQAVKKEKEQVPEAELSESKTVNSKAPMMVSKNVSELDNSEDIINSEYGGQRSRLALPTDKGTHSRQNSIATNPKNA